MQIKFSNSWNKDDAGEVYSPDAEPTSKEFYANHVLRLKFSNTLTDNLRKIVQLPSVVVSDDVFSALTVVTSSGVVDREGTITY